MKTRPHSALLPRLGAVTLLAAGLVWCGAGAQAATAPLPVPSAPLPSAPVPSAPLPAPLAGPVQQVLEGAGVPTGQPSSATGGVPAPGTTPSTPSAGRPASGSAGSGPASSGPGSASSQSAPSQRTSSPGGVQARTPVASVCLIPTGTASPAFEVSLSAVGQDLSSPLVRQFPQVFTACPARAVAAGPDEVVAADAVVKGLVGACVRVTRQVAPLRTTLVVLDHDLISELTKAGVPLDKLVVPCPAGAGAASGTSGVPAGTPGAAVGSPVPTGVAETALPDRLAFTGASDPRPLLLTGATLLALGVVLTRKARLLTAAV